MISCTVKLKLRPAQERLLNRWLWHLTGVYNWAVKKIEADASNRIYHSRYDLEALLVGHSKRMGIPAKVLEGAERTAHDAWQRCFKRLAKRPKLKGRRNRLNSILFRESVAPRPNCRYFLSGVGPVRFHKQEIPAGRVKQARVIRRASGWYLCLSIEAEPRAIQPVLNGEVGIDPGFASLITLSTGEVVDHPHELQATEQRLAQAQRGKNARLTARLKEREANQRNDRNHKLSRRIVSENALICWSNDNHRSLARMFGKSVASAAHGYLRTQLAYKSSSCGRQFVEVSNRYSTRACSACGRLSGPAGYAGLRVRHWECACGAQHSRDVNAAVNTLIAGRGSRHEIGREAESEITKWATQ